MKKNSILVLLCLLILTSCNSLKKIVFAKSDFTVIKQKGLIFDNNSGLLLDLQGLEMRYGELPDSTNLITNNSKLVEKKDIASYANSIFNNLKITNTDTILFFIAGEILVYKPHNFNSQQSDYQYILNDTINNIYCAILPDKFSKNDATCIFRKLIFNKTHKRIIIVDTYKVNNDWLSMAYFTETETKYNSKILPRIWTTKYLDLTNPQNMLFIADYINEFDYITQKNQRNLQLSSKYPFDMFSDYFKNGKFYNYYASYLGEKLSDYYLTPQTKGSFLQALATYFSFAEDTHKSDSVWFLMMNNTINNKQIEHIGNINDLLQSTKKYQVIMFNEAHNVPKHRLFLSNLLDSLYKQGFRYIALEAFYNDSIFEQTGYLTEANGIYIVEPTFANLIRKAYKKGFKIIEYDDFSNDREHKQAENIYNQTINIDDNAKVLVYCGYQHIDTDRMAGEFQKISGITPLTIDQTYSYYYCLGKYTTDTAFLIKPNKEDFYYNADLFVFNDLDILNNKNNTEIKIPAAILRNCKIICVYEQNEFDYLTKIKKKPLPVCVQNIENKNIVEVSLEKGKYYILFMNNLGEVLEYTTISIN